MPKRVYRSKTQYLSQPRDSRGRWGKIGSALASPFKKGASAVSKVGGALAKRGMDFGYSFSPYKATAGGYVTHSKSLPGGFAITSRTETRIHPVGKSPFEKAVNNTVEGGLSKIRNQRAQTVARAVTGRPRNTQGSGVRITNGVIRSKTSKEIASARMRTAKRKGKKLKKLEASRGVPSTITGQAKAKRPARRGK